MPMDPEVKDGLKRGADLSVRIALDKATDAATFLVVTAATGNPVVGALAVVAKKVIVFSNSD